MIPPQIQNQQQKVVFLYCPLSASQQSTPTFNTDQYKMDQDLQLIKIVIIGNSGTGKTNISTRYMKNEFNDGYKASVGVQFFAKTIQIQGKDVKIALWDTAGQERYKSIGKVYYKGARGILAVYDITDPQSYVDIQAWLRCANEAVNLSDITVFVVGNKTDLSSQRKITFERAVKEYKEEFDVDCWEVSAKTGDKVEELFQTLFQKIYEKGQEVKSSVFYGESELVTYSQVDRDSLSIAKGKQAQRQMQPIGEVIMQEHQQSHYPVFQKMDFQKKLTLTNEDEMLRVQQSKKKKRCCR